MFIISLGCLDIELEDIEFYERIPKSCLDCPCVEACDDLNFCAQKPKLTQSIAPYI
jgi:hypothetical protein